MVGRSNFECRARFLQLKSGFLALEGSVDHSEKVWNWDDDESGNEEDIKNESDLDDKDDVDEEGNETEPDADVVDQEIVNIITPRHPRVKTTPIHTKFVKLNDPISEKCASPVPISPAEGIEACRPRKYSKLELTDKLKINDRISPCLDDCIFGKFEYYPTCRNSDDILDEKWTTRYGDVMAEVSIKLEFSLDSPCMIEPEFEFTE